MVESSEGTTYPGVNHPGLRAKQEGCLNYRLVKISGGPGVCPLQTQNPVEMCLSTPSLLNISNRRLTVVIRCVNGPPKAFRFCHLLQMSPVGLEGHRRARLHLLLPQPLYFPLLLLGAHLRGLLIPYHWPPGNKLITFGSAQEGVVPLLQDH